MCFSFSLAKYLEYIENRYSAFLEDKSVYNIVYYSNAFEKPKHPVITNQYSNKIQLYQWGLIPFWVKDEIYAKKISTGTINARSETVFQLPSFKNSIINKRCLILVDGFFEWREYNGKKYPYYIKLKNDDVFSMAGIWDSWKNPLSNEEVFTFSVITIRANSLLEKIHNVKKRMPVILNQNNEKKWLANDISPNEIKSFMQPYPDFELEAFTVSKFISKRGIEHNVPRAIEKYDYQELPEI